MRVEAKHWIVALREGDEEAVWAALDEPSEGARCRAGLWTIPGKEAKGLIVRGGSASRAALLDHPDGRVREAALRALNEKAGKALPFVLRRANDWVPALAHLASTRAVVLLSRAEEETLVKSASRVYALTLQRRADHRELVEAYVGEVAKRPGLARRLRRAFACGKIGIWAFQNLRGNDETLRSLAEEGLRSQHPGIQARAARIALGDGSLWPTLAASHNPQIRRIGLDVASAEVLEAALTDPHVGVRNDARYLLGKRDYAAFYRARLPEPGAVSGLGEMGTSADATLLRPFLTDLSANVRERTLAALARLLAEGAEPEIRNALRDPSRKVQRAAIEAIDRITVVIEPEETISLGFARGDAWSLMERAPRWEALLAVLRHAETFPAADAWVARWTKRAYGIRPSSAEAADSLVLLAEAASTLRPETLAEARAVLKPWLR